ncbi:hypothetical protein RJ641_027890 [Dillenia turbinata]|uniref:Uncharacterized protein n=1 Tax=Dillenia turbinata TaxID=194707 RepID=A0AAN8ZQ15_9MAGN
MRKRQEKCFELGSRKHVCTFSIPDLTFVVVIGKHTSAAGSVTVTVHVFFLLIAIPQLRKHTISSRAAVVVQESRGVRRRNGGGVRRGVLLLSVRSRPFPHPRRLQDSGGILPESAEEATEKETDQEGAFAAKTEEMRLRVRRDGASNSSDLQHRRSAGVRGEVLDAVVSVGQGGYRFGEGNVGEVLQYRILEKFFSKREKLTVVELSGDEMRNHYEVGQLDMTSYHVFD